MKFAKSLFLHFFMFCLFIPVQGWSQTQATKAASAAIPAEDNFKYTKLYMNDIVADDGTEKTQNTISMKVLREDAVDALKQYSITYSTSAETLDVVEAYTQKPDGRRIDASKNDFQITASGGRQGAAPAFSDQTTLTVVFPDVTMGDTVNIVYNRAVIDPLFPKQFSNLYVFPKTSIYDDVRISYSAPLSLKAKYKNYGMTETVNKQENGRQLLSWTYKNPTAEKVHYISTPISKIGDKPGIAISTFPSFATIAESYGARAKPKAVVTNEIKTLADSITKGIVEPREQTKALYNWEIANITYAGNCIGIGAVVPRDLAFVLKNKMGDCKDHATLLQALLSAKNIESTQALIGVNTIYTLPDVPLVSIVNHVINYIPSLNLFVDATSGLPFGYLPVILSGKPVLLVDGYKDGMTTPVMPVGSRRQKVIDHMTIATDGSIDGTTWIDITSPEMGSHDSLQALRNITPKQLDDASKKMLEGSGYQGSVELKKGSWDEKSLTYKYGIKYHLNDYVHIGTPGAIPIEPPFSPQIIANIIGSVVQAVARKHEKLTYDIACSNDYVEEAYQYDFPKGMEVLATPKAVSEKNSVQTYTANYTLSGQTLTISRIMNDTTPGPTCKPEIETEYEQLAVKVWSDLKAQIVYR